MAAKRNLSSDISVDADLATKTKMHKETPLSPSRITTPVKRAQVEGIVRSISPGKGRFFDGELSDGETTVRVVGFEPEQLKKLTEYCAKQQPCLLRHCEISEGRSGKPEIVIKTFTKVEKSTTTFQIPDEENDDTPHIDLVDLPLHQNFDRVTVTVTVLKLRDIKTVGTDNKLMQQCVVADKSGKGTLILWGDKVNTLEENKSYLMRRIQVHVFASKYQLQFPRSGFTVKPLEEDLYIHLSEESDNDQDDTNTGNNMTIIGVQNFDIVYTCIACKNNIENTGSSDVNICENCGTTQRLLDSRTTAKLLVEGPDGGRMTLRAYTSAMKEIVSTGYITIEALLGAPPFNVEFNNFHVITAIHRP